MKQNWLYQDGKFEYLSTDPLAHVIRMEDNDCDEAIRKLGYLTAFNLGTESDKVNVEVYSLHDELIDGTYQKCKPDNLLEWPEFMAYYEIGGNLYIVYVPSFPDLLNLITMSIIPVLECIQKTEERIAETK